MNVIAQSAAHSLEGLALQDGWIIEKKIVPAEGQTGANLSIGYVARNSTDGRMGFVKVLDLTRALLTPDPARTLQALTAGFNFERDLLEQCREHNMSKVVLALNEDNIVVTGESGNPETIQYIVFELAESDFRKKVLLSQSYDVAMELHALHDVATGIMQLHKRDIAHQDLKPSNVLVFPGRVAKVADLGRSFKRGKEAPHDDFPIAGDPTYAAPEHLYGYLPSNWKARRLACDLYHLGSLITFVFSGLGMTRILADNIHDDYSWHQWAGSYGEVLPYLRNSHENVLESIKDYFPAGMKNELTNAVSELCDPDPMLRGHPRSRAQGNRHGLERYVSLLDLLGTRAEITAKRVT